MSETATQLKMNLMMTMADLWDRVMETGLPTHSRFALFNDVRERLAESDPLEWDMRDEEWFEARVRVYMYRGTDIGYAKYEDFLGLEISRTEISLNP